MKIDSVVPTDESLQESHAATGRGAGIGSDADESSVSSHDLRASLAIVNGFSTALGTSFKDLSEQYRMILEADDDTRVAEAADRLLMLDADCRFCLSRLHIAIEKLKSRLESEQVMDGSDLAEDTGT